MGIIVPVRFHVEKQTAATQPAAAVMFCLDPWELGLMSNEKKDLLV